MWKESNLWRENNFCIQGKVGFIPTPQCKSSAPFSLTLNILHQLFSIFALWPHGHGHWTWTSSRNMVYELYGMLWVKEVHEIPKAATNKVYSHKSHLETGQFTWCQRHCFPAALVGRHLVRRYCSFRFHSIPQIPCKTSGSQNVFPNIMGNLLCPN